MLMMMNEWQWNIVGCELLEENFKDLADENDEEGVDAEGIEHGLIINKMNIVNK